MLSSSVIALVTGASLLFAAAGTFHHYSSPSSVSVDLSSWKWIAQIELGIDHTEAQAAEIQMPMPAGKVPGWVSSLRKKIRAKVPHKRIIAQLKKATPLDEVHETHAAPVVVAQPISVPAPVNASAEELTRMQQLHRILRGQFVASFHQTLPVDQVTTQIAAAVIQPAAVDIQPVVAPRAKQHKHARRRPQTSNSASAPVEKAKSKLASIQDCAESAGTTLVQLEQSQKTLHEITQQLDSVLGHYEVPVAPTRADELPASAPETEAVVEKAAEHSEGLAPMATQPVAAAPEPTRTEPVAKVTETPPTPQEPAALPSEHAIQIASNSLVALQGAIREYSTHTDYSPAPSVTVNTQPGPTPAAKQEHSSVQDQGRQKDDNGPLYTGYVEAFDWNTPIAQFESEELSNQGWMTSKASGHWPTLTWSDRNPVPLISSNTAEMLRRIPMPHVDLQSEAGIVFGRIPAGWNVKFSGRSERIILLSPTNQVVTEGDVSIERYFAFLNAEPGAHIVTISAPSDGASGTIGVPVLRGTATYLDLGAINRQTVSGTIYDASSYSGPRGLSKVQVRVAGSDTLQTMTQTGGAFEIQNVAVAAPYPFYLDTKSETGFTHRHKIQAEHTTGVALFQFKSKQVDGWISQLQGGVSVDSGLVVAAVPDLVRQAGDSKLVPSFHNLVNNSLDPETYTLDPNGELQPRGVLGAESSQFVSVQVPEGPALVQVEDRSQKVLWSELVFASPGVINVVTQ